MDKEQVIKEILCSQLWRRYCGSTITRYPTWQECLKGGACPLCSESAHELAEKLKPENTLTLTGFNTSSCGMNGLSFRNSKVKSEPATETREVVVDWVREWIFGGAEDVLIARDSPVMDKLFAIIAPLLEQIEVRGRGNAVAWIRSHELIKPDKDSLTRFEPYYHIEERELC
jgi:hypothetical protein